MSYYLKRKRGKGRIGKGELRRREGSLTRSPVYVVQVADAVLVRPVADFTVESWLAGASASGVLDDHGLAQVLFKFEVVLSSFHELGGLREVLPFPLQRFLACRTIDPK